LTNVGYDVAGWTVALDDSTTLNDHLDGWERNADERFSCILYEGHDGFNPFLMDTDGMGHDMGWAASAWVTTGNEGRFFL
jgi:hypothetical protein